MSHQDAAAMKPKVSPIAIVALCAAAASIDGIDLQIMAMIAPEIASDWRLPLGDFGIVYSAGMLGLVAGALVLGPLGDRLGRMRVVAAAMVCVGLATALTATSQSLLQLVLWRFASCVGLGGLITLLVVVAFDSSSVRWRSMSVASVLTGFPLGGFLGGAFIAQWLRQFEWPQAFVLFGLMTVVLAAVFALLSSSIVDAPARRAEPHESMFEFRALVRSGNLRRSILVWCLFSFTLVAMYNLLSWLPSMLVRAGYSTSDAAMTSALQNLGAIFGGPLIGYLVGRRGPGVVTITYAIGAAVILVMSVTLGSPNMVLFTCFAAGVLVAGSHGANGALAAEVYTEMLRSRGVSAAQIVGRLAATIAPIVIGYAMNANATNQQIIAGTAFSAAGASLSAWLLRGLVSRAR